jgi:ribosomal protein L24E
MDSNNPANVHDATFLVTNYHGQVTWLAIHKFLLFSDSACMAGAAIWNKSPQSLMWTNHKKALNQEGLTQNRLVAH